MKETRHMSENDARQDIIQTMNRLRSNLAYYEDGYKTGRKDALEHAKTLRDPDRLAEIQFLQEALRRKNERHRRLRKQYKQLKDTKRPRARAHVYANQIGWEVTIMRGPRWHNSDTFPTHHEAPQWALQQLKEANR